MFHVGLDIHSTRISICGLNETGQVVHRSQLSGIEDMLRTLKALPDRFEVSSAWTYRSVRRSKQAIAFD
jgi:hypothetical protein